MEKQMAVLGGTGCTFMEQLCVANYPLVQGKNSLGFANEGPDFVDSFESVLSRRATADLKNV